MWNYYKTSRKIKLGKAVIETTCLLMITIILLSLCAKMAFQKFTFLQVQMAEVKKLDVHRLAPGRRLEAPRNIFRDPTPNNSNIFFFEGTCARSPSGTRQDGDMRIRLDITQACAVESAARANPDMAVFLFSSCRLDVATSMAESSQMVREIFAEHKNVFVWHQSLESLFKNTELEDLFYSKRMFNSAFKTQSSNLVRVLLLKTFGGTYFDLDFIVRRPLAPLADTFAGLQTSSQANNAVLRLGLEAVGRRVADMALRELRLTFDSTVWGHNGPAMITRVLKKLCQSEKLRPTSGGDCEGFVLYDQEVFYPVSPIDWRLFYRDDDDAVDKVFELVQNSVAVHLWNSMQDVVRFNRYPTLWRHSKQPKIVLQLNYCPIAHTFNRVKFLGDEGVIAPKIFDLHQFLYSL